LKLLIDNQLPEALAVFLKEQGFDARHVRRLGLAAAADERIWQFAKTGSFGIVTMDEDFCYLASRHGTPPQVVWVRLGNVRRPALLATFAAVLPELRQGLESGTPVIEISQS
jgi:predicted nuclease of predicted toxin-antitoxin system